MFRFWTIALISGAALAQSAKPIPFDDWMKGNQNSPIVWSLRTTPAALTQSQRLTSSIVASIPVAKIRPKMDRLAMVMQIRDANGATYRSFPAAFSRRQMGPGTAEVVFSQGVFVVPGDYEIAGVVYDTQSLEHNLKRLKLHVPGLFRDPLRDFWRDLPRVGFFGARGGHLWLPVEAKRRLSVDLVAIQSITGKQDNVLTRIEVLSQMQIPHGSMRLTVLDLPHQKTAYTQEIREPISARRVAAALPRLDPRVVHADLLSKYKEGAQFFVDQISAMAAADEPGIEHVVIVLAAPWDFPKEGIAMAKAAPGAHVFFIHCDPPGRLERSAAPLPPVTPRIGPSEEPVTFILVDKADSLAYTLAPLHPREFHAITPIEFRRALGAMLREIGSLN